ncbi:MAG: phosphorothioated DNA-binding restriction endonuclease [Bacteroidales bacterium]
MKKSHAEWIAKFSNFKTWRQKGVRAPHKPLLTLLLLCRSMDKYNSQVTFGEVSEQLAKLLKEFGPSRKVYHPENPFWHLQNEGFWTVSSPFDLEKKKPGSSPTKESLLKDGVYGELSPELWQALKLDPSLVSLLADTILHQFWPETLHESIRNAIGLPTVVISQTIKRKRDPQFRVNVLRAYRSTCVICGLDGRLGGIPLGIDAGHIKWHSCNGPDSIKNGLALCSFHHVALDAGAISLNDNLRIIISVDLTGGKRIEDVIYRYEGREIMLPQPGFDQPEVEFLQWHRKEVFRSPGRLLPHNGSLLKAAETEHPYY